MSIDYLESQQAAELDVGSNLAHSDSKNRFEALLATLLDRKKDIVVESLNISMKAFLLSEIFRVSGRDLLVLTGEGQEEAQLLQNLEFFVASKPVQLPSWETLPSEKVAPSADLVGERQKAFDTIRHRKSPNIVLSSLQASLQKILSSRTSTEGTITIFVGEELPFDVFSQHLALMGYTRRPVTVEKGEFSIRGGIIDIFPVTETRPIRIEFSGDQVEDIRYFDALSQKTKEKITSISITEGKELELLQSAKDEDLGTIFDLLGKETIIILDDLEKLEDRYAGLLSQGGVKSKIFLGIQEWLDEVQKHRIVFLSGLPLESLTTVHVLGGTVKGSYALHSVQDDVKFSMFSRDFMSSRIVHPFVSLSAFYEEACCLQEPPEGSSLIDCYIQLQESVPHTVVVQSLVELEWFKKKLEERGSSLSQKIQIQEGYISCGFVRRDTHAVLFATSEVTGRVTVRRDTRRMTSLVAEYDAFDMNLGDIVVHFHHGIAKFCGIERRSDVYGREQEFFVLEYAERSKLYVPLSQAHLISKYIGGEEGEVKLHALGSNRWKRLREDTERAILGYASELLQIQANRVIKGGFAFPEDGLSMKLFEAEFPYNETEDQLKAIAEIKKDMTSSKAMDRLICGDVGYGKTEVAMRAAFKAVSDGKKQVAVLAPTTVLALQHYENFLDRMGTFGVRIGVISRFSSQKQNKETISKVCNGDIDIVVGTHRLVQKDVVFKDLGLVIIDEEQRFGVRIKEHLKVVKEGVDCVTLSATPIPRTLYMSLMGARELSTISTPPHDRLPIKTVVCEPSDEIIQNALMRELNRGGQAFVIHNRVETIFEHADRIKALIPRAKIAVAHGQMDADALDVVFHAFKKGDVEVLVATSIVENGIDIPNANTIIVDRADQFGIADLYQLRGRVGRWNRRAYAYFLATANRLLSEVARKRIEAIAQAGGYGGGLKMAMRDLEIRGAGDILGTEQSGNVAAIGFHLYCKLLKRTVESLQGKSSVWMIDTRIETPFDAKLPEFYVNEVSLRMEFYQRLGEVKSLSEIDDIGKELVDRFGILPEPAEWLLAATKVRFLGAQKGFTLIKIESCSVLLERKSGEKSCSNRILMSKAKTPEEFVTKLGQLFSA